MRTPIPSFVWSLSLARPGFLPGLLMGAAALTAPAAAQAPTADVEPWLDTLVGGERATGALLNDFVTAFLPPPAIAQGGHSAVEPASIVVRRDGAVLLEDLLYTHDDKGIFSRSRRRTSGRIPFDAAGSYELGFVVGGTEVTTLPFEVELRQGGDVFDPTQVTVIDAPLLHWAQIYVADPRADQPRTSVSLRLRSGDLIFDSVDRLDVTIERDGRVVFDCKQINAVPLRKDVRWHHFDKSIAYPERQGGGVVFIQDLTATDGDYRIVVRAGDAVVQAHDYTVAGGKIVPHARMALDHQPHTAFLLPRTLRGDESTMTDVYWMPPVEGDVAAAVAAGVSAPAAAKPSAATRAAWAPAPALPDRATGFVVTDAAPRVDAHLAVGDGIIAYGTGPNVGVSYLKIGDDQPVNFEGSGTASSKRFWTAGSKIVLVQKNELAVHDTASGKTHTYAEDTFELTRSPSTALKGGSVAVDGLLAATLNDPQKVGDRAAVKVVDLSGAEPTLIAVGAPDGEDPDRFNAIGVGAADGVVVITNERDKRIYVADVAPGARFHTIDLVDHGGVSKDCVPLVRDGRIVYFDTTRERNLCSIALSGETVPRQHGPVGKAEFWYDCTGGRVALAGGESSSSNYEVRIGSLDGEAAVLGGTGEEVGNAKRGYGQRVAVAPNGLVFASGASASGVASSEYLGVSDGGAWTVATAGGEPIPAVGVAYGGGVIAYKTGKSRDVKIAYVLLGTGTKPGDLAR